MFGLIFIVIAAFVFIDADVNYLREGHIIFDADCADFDFDERIVGQGVEILSRYGHCQWRKII